MALFTGKGDNGTTKTFGCSQRISKSSAVSEALGTLDEVNSFLGLCKVQARADNIMLGKISVAHIVHELQDDLFIIQAEVAGASKKISARKITWQEKIIHNIEKKLPPIKTFFISGGTELSSRFDVARTLSRRAERRVVAVHEEAVALGSRALRTGPYTGSARIIHAHTLAYLNRLSSVLYALVRFSNQQQSVGENAPDYS